MQKEIYCNACAKKICYENGIFKEDVFEGKKEWGYFSKKDLETDHFYLCEECYDKIVSAFLIPIERKENLEVL